MNRCAVLTGFLVLVGLAGGAVWGEVDGGLMGGTYVFDFDHSIVIQTGGFMGVYETYSVEGRFELTLGPADGAASFSHVDANLTGDSGLLYTTSLGKLFNMTELVGTVVSGSRIDFEGRAGDFDDSRVELALTFRADSVHLAGRTIPPPGSADMFEYELDAVARGDQGKYCGGHGTQRSPYLICNASQLNQIALNEHDWDKHFKLSADIDLGVLRHAAFPIGTTRESAFSGVFDGDGHAISNLSLNRVRSELSNTALFGVVRGERAAVRNLGIVDPNVRGTYCVGSLVGLLAEGTVSNCYAIRGHVYSNDENVGGLIGNACCGSTVSQCYASTTVLGDEAVGGLVGMDSNSTITECYAAGVVSGDDEVGGLVGASLEGSISLSYWDRDTSGIDLMCGSETGRATGCDNSSGKTTPEMMQQSTFVRWDFINVWNIGENQTYPYLRVYAAGDINHDGIVNFPDVAILGEEWAQEE